MKPRKPDRFERAATRAAYKLTWDKQHPDGGEFQLAIVKELRREHAWMRRMVKKYMKSIYGLRADLPPEFVCGYMQAGDEFLALLDQRRK